MEYCENLKCFELMPCKSHENEARISALMAMCSKNAPKYPKSVNISVDDLLKLQSEAVVPVIVDVRDPDEIAVSIIPGALTKEHFEATNVDKGRPIVVYCTVGVRSGFYTERLLEQGYNAFNLNGSIVAYTHKAGTQLVDPHSGLSTNRVHVYGKTWDLAHSRYTIEVKPS